MKNDKIEKILQDSTYTTEEPENFKSNKIFLSITISICKVMIKILKSYLVQPNSVEINQ